MPSYFEQYLSNNLQTLHNDHPFYAIKQRAIGDFKKQGLPTLKHESYKYTPIATFLTKYFAPAPSNTPAAAFPTVNHHDDIDAYRIVLPNGKISTLHATLAAFIPSVKISTFQQAYAEQNPVFLAHFAQHAQSKADALIALNTALFEEGLFIHIDDHAIIDKPILLLHPASTNTPQAIACPRMLIVAGTNSQVSIINAWQSSGFVNAVAEIVVQEDVRLDYYTLQTNLAPQSYLINTTKCHQAQHSVYNTYTFTWSGAMVRNNLHSVIDAPYSRTHMYGLYYLREQQHVDNCTAVDHCQPNTHSNELYKGIMMDASTGVFNGRIYVRPSAQKTHAFQANNNLMLSEHATLHTKPQLEIWADDVKCSHGATTGQLDTEQLFYLRARGIQEATARSLLFQAFANEVIDKVPLISLRKQLHANLAEQALPYMLH